MVEEGNNDDMQLDESLFAAEQPEQSDSIEEQPQEPQKQEEEIPEKYRGKSAMEIIRMHQDAERLIGKQGNEVGELRKIVDDIVHKAQTSETAPKEPEVDFFEDPKGATAKTAKEVFNSDPEYQKIKQTVDQMTRQNAAQQLLQRHPDAVQLSNDPKFGEWVGKSQLRQKLFMQAHNQFDYESASELFDMYKETKAYNSDVGEAAQASRKKDLNKASTGSGKASSETRGKPILSREAIVDLRIKDPERYQALLPSLKQAYRDGRVR